MSTKLLMSKIQFFHFYIFLECRRNSFSYMYLPECFRTRSIEDVKAKDKITFETINYDYKAYAPHNNFSESSTGVSLPN